MRKMLIVLVALALACAAAPALAGTPGRFVQYPDISGNDHRVHLGTRPVDGAGERRRGHAADDAPRMENVPKFSPDGKLIAFTGQDEGPNLYVIPATGGAPTRVTYMGAGAAGRRLDAGRHEHRLPLGPREHVPADREAVHASRRTAACRNRCRWTAASSARTRRTARSWSTTAGATRSTTGSATRAASTRTSGSTTSRRSPTRRSPTTSARTPTRCGSATGSTSCPTAAKSGIANLFTYDFATKKVEQVTDFADFDVQMPETDGTSIVFVQAGQLYVLDTATNKVRRVERRDAERPLGAGRPHDQPARLHPRRWRCRTTGRRPSSRRAATSTWPGPTTAARRAT